MTKEKFMETCMLITGPLGSLFTIPQIIKIYFTHTHHVAGLALPTWTAYLIICFLWIVYGFVFKKVALIASNGLYIIVYIAVVYGILAYS